MVTCYILPLLCKVVLKLWQKHVSYVTLLKLSLVWEQKKLSWISLLLLASHMHRFKRTVVVNLPHSFVISVIIFAIIFWCCCCSHGGRKKTLYLNFSCAAVWMKYKSVSWSFMLMKFFWSHLTRTAAVVVSYYSIYTYLRNLEEGNAWFSSWKLHRIWQKKGHLVDAIKKVGEKCTCKYSLGLTASKFTALYVRYSTMSRIWA